MTDSSPLTHGHPCWIELSAPKHVPSLAFYKGLLGWKSREVTPARGLSYTMFTLDGHDVAGLVTSNSDTGEWLTYIAVDDVDATAARAVSLGGSLQRAPMDIGSLGRMARITGPRGASLALWQADTHTGTTGWGNPGAPCWIELSTDHTAASLGFHSQLLGWDPLPQPMGPLTYITYRANGHHVAGMMGLSDDWGTTTPNWLLFIAVKDVIHSASLVTGLGGQLVSAPSTIPEVGLFALVQDPGGALFAIISLEGHAKRTQSKP